MLRAALDAVVFSSVWLTAAVGALCAAASLSMGFRPVPSVVAIACAGTLVVYIADRLRDLDHDREAAPARSAFIARHVGAMKCLGLGAGAVALGLAATLPMSAVLLLAPVLVVGLAHRRLKQIPFAGAAYIAVAWLVVVVGLPAVVDGHAANIGWVAAVIGVALLASTIASDVRDVGASFNRLRPGVAVRIARVLSVLGLAVAALAPASVQPLAAVPAFTLASVIWFRSGERYGLVVVDGALLVGAIAAIGMLGPGAG